MSWLRQGIGAQISQEESLGELPGELQSRAEVPIRLKIEAVPMGGDAYQSTGAENDIVQNIQVFGPGEIIGINPSAVVKTEPQPGNTNYEPNYLPYIEFYEEDFPWRYSPGKAKDGKLRPWLVLLVLRADEFKKVSFPDAHLPALTHGDKSIPFPPEAQTWSWAHVHVNQPLTVDRDQGQDYGKPLFNLINEQPNLASSRLMSSRRLTKNTSYRAFLLPAFEQGRLAGLGASNDRILEEDVRQSSWRNHKADEFADHWPYYYEWAFRTTDELDFEFLVRKIRPRVLPPDMGRRPMDCREAGYEISYEAGVGDQQGILDLEGALQSPGADEDYDPVVGETDTEVKKKEFLRQLRDFLNLNTDLIEVERPANFYIQNTNSVFSGDDQEVEDDPIVLPPLYGQWHAGHERIDYNIAPTTGEEDVAEELPATPEQIGFWFNQLNLDPRNRTAAGLGTQVVQQNQESYMDRAWAQVGDVLNSLRKLKQAELSVESSDKLFQKFFDRLPALTFYKMTAKIHAKLLATEGQSFQALNTIAFPAPIWTVQSYSRLLRFNSPIFRRLLIPEAEVRTFELELLENFAAVAREVPLEETGGRLFDLNHLRSGVGQVLGEEAMIEGGIIDGELLLTRLPGIISRDMPEEDPAGYGETRDSLVTYFNPSNWDYVFSRPQIDEEGPFQDLCLELTDTEGEVGDIVTILLVGRAFSGVLKTMNFSIRYDPDKLFFFSTPTVLSDQLKDDAGAFRGDFCHPAPGPILLRSGETRYTDPGIITLEWDGGAEGIPVSFQNLEELIRFRFRIRGTSDGDAAEDRLSFSSDPVPIGIVDENGQPVRFLSKNGSVNGTAGLQVNFSTKKRAVQTGELLTFFNLTSGLGPDLEDPTISYAWMFEGGTPTRSSISSPTVSFDSPGIYQVSLTVSAGEQTATREEPQYIRVISPVNEFKVSISEQLNPRRLITAKAWRGIRVKQRRNDFPIAVVRTTTAAAPEEIVDLVAIPVFEDAMYVALRDFGEEAFLPGLDKIPENTFSVLETNQRFIESFMTGINHEFSRELLWREYPTTQKGSYFRKFWDSVDGTTIEDKYDIRPIISWGNRGLGANHPSEDLDEEEPSAANRFVFVVRGELLKKFPRTVIYLQRAEFIREEGRITGRRRCTDPTIDNKYLFPIFQAKVEPDITFLGFDTDTETARGDGTTNAGYFVIVKERPGEPRFGLDLPPADGTSPKPPGDPDFTWNDGNWDHVELDENDFVNLKGETYRDLLKSISPEEPDPGVQWGKKRCSYGGNSLPVAFHGSHSRRCHGA